MHGSQLTRESWKKNEESIEKNNESDSYRSGCCGSDRDCAWHDSKAEK